MSKDPVHNRQKMRNQVSALQSRIKKKEEVLFLNDLIKHKDDRVKQLISVLNKHLEEDLILEIGQELLQKIDTS